MLCPFGQVSLATQGRLRFTWEAAAGGHKDLGMGRTGMEAFLENGCKWDMTAKESC